MFSYFSQLLVTQTEGLIGPDAKAMASESKYIRSLVMFIVLTSLTLFVLPLAANQSERRNILNNHELVKNSCAIRHIYLLKSTIELERTTVFRHHLSW